MSAWNDERKLYELLEKFNNELLENSNNELMEIFNNELCGKKL